MQKNQNVKAEWVSLVAIENIEVTTNGTSYGLKVNKSGIKGREYWVPVNLTDNLDVLRQVGEALVHVAASKQVSVKKTAKAEPKPAPKVETTSKKTAKPAPKVAAKQNEPETAKKARKTAKNEVAAASQDDINAMVAEALGAVLPGILMSMGAKRVSK